MINKGMTAMTTTKEVYVAFGTFDSNDQPTEAGILLIERNEREDIVSRTLLETVPVNATAPDGTVLFLARADAQAFKYGCSYDIETP